MKAGAGAPRPGAPGAVTAGVTVEVVVPAASERPDDPELTAQIVSPATAATTNAATAARGPRARRRSVGPDEGVDGNGREEQREVRVRQAEERDRPLRRRVATQPDRLGDQHHPEDPRGDPVDDTH